MIRRNWLLLAHIAVAIAVLVLIFIMEYNMYQLLARVRLDLNYQSAQIGDVRRSSQQLMRILLAAQPHTSDTLECEVTSEHPYIWTCKEPDSEKGPDAGGKVWGPAGTSAPTAQPHNDDGVWADVTHTKRGKDGSSQSWGSSGTACSPTPCTPPPCKTRGGTTYPGITTVDGTSMYRECGEVIVK